MWHGSLFKQLPNTQRRSLLFPTHTKQKLKKNKKTKENPKKYIEKAKRKEKRKPTRKNRDK
jgi:hypothetical protein